jgi:preprotein translocase subunit SecG
MENVVLTILLILALALIIVVLMQRSEGGGLGIGGGGGGAISSRSAANALTKLTWILGVAFMAASLVMTALAAQNARKASVVDLAPEASQPQAPGSELLPPSVGDGPLTPPRVD